MQYPFPKDEGIHYKLCGVFHSTDEGASWSEGGPCVSAGPPGDEPRCAVLQEQLIASFPPVPIPLMIWLCKTIAD